MQLECDQIVLAAWRPLPSAEVVLAGRQKGVHGRKPAAVIKLGNPPLADAMQGSHRAITLQLGSHGRCSKEDGFVERAA